MKSHFRPARADRWVLLYLTSGHNKALKVSHSDCVCVCLWFIGSLTLGATLNWTDALFALNANSTCTRGHASGVVFFLCMYVFVGGIQPATYVNHIWPEMARKPWWSCAPRNRTDEPRFVRMLSRTMSTLLCATMRMLSQHNPFQRKRCSSINTHTIVCSRVRVCVCAVLHELHTPVAGVALHYLTCARSFVRHTP